MSQHSEIEPVDRKDLREMHNEETPGEKETPTGLLVQPDRIYEGRDESRLYRKVLLSAVQYRWPYKLTASG